MKKTTQRIFYGLFILFLWTIETIEGTCHDGSVGCITPLGNIALHRTINASSTCGDPPMEFCVFQDLEECSVCNSSDPLYVIQSINDDDTTTWWQSENGADDVVVQLDLASSMLFSSTYILWRSPRPESMVLEKSVDNGANWIPFRYFSSTCQATFGLSQFNGLTPPNSTEPVCLGSESLIMPSDFGEVRVDPLQGS